MREIKGKNVLVTGGAGFIGSHLVDALLEGGAKNVVIVDNFMVGKERNIENAKKYNNFKVYRDDASDLQAMVKIVKEENIEIIYNMATIALRYSFFNPYKAYMINVDIAKCLLYMLKEKMYETLIHMSSSEAYGTTIYSPMDEKHPTNPTTPYAGGKLAADIMVQTFNNIESLDVTIIRPFNNYGPRQNEDALAAIIPLTAKRLQEGEKPIIEGSGEQTRDFIYVKDTVRALLLAYKNEAAKGELINVGSGIEISMNEVIATICNYYGYNGEIEKRPERPADVKRLCASSEKAKRILGFKPEIGFEEGIKYTLDWYKQNL